MLQIYNHDFFDIYRPQMCVGLVSSLGNRCIGPFHSDTGMKGNKKRVFVLNYFDCIDHHRNILLVNIQAGTLFVKMICVIRKHK